MVRANGKQTYKPDPRINYALAIRVLHSAAFDGSGRCADCKDPWPCRMYRTMAAPRQP